MKRVAVTGLSGVLGKILINEIPNDFEIVDLYHNNKASSVKIKSHQRLDLLNIDKISKTLKKVKPDVILHMAAITHIDKCEEDKKRGKNGHVWRINVEATNEIAKYCAKQKVQLVFLSTECVFDGKRKIYTEESARNPINWYGFTKGKAEELLLKSKAPVAIIRSVVAYHKNDKNKTIYGKILSSLKSEKNINAVVDRRFTPTHTQDIVNAINIIIKNKLVGIYHVAPKKVLSPYDFALLVAEKNNFSKKKVKKINLVSFYGSERASIRLLNSCLKGKKTNKILKFTPASPEDVL